MKLSIDATQARDARVYLDSLILHGVKLGLQHIEDLMERSGNPHRAYPLVHVAGTNGKGSVVTFLAAMLRAAGYRVGRFTSPHLLDVTERFLIDGCPMDESALHENIRWFKNIADTMDCPPTYFEMNTAIAFRWFARESVDVALIEVGMGGRFDATNIVSPLLCAITTIDYDHMQFLGATLPEIAFEKAGILKPGVPAVVGTIPPEALAVIQARAGKVGAPLTRAGYEYHAAGGGVPQRPLLSFEGLGISIKDAAIGLSGTHQADNGAVALSLATMMRRAFDRLDDHAIIAGLQEARWPGRFERVLDTPPVIMDVAHNPAGCRMLAQNLESCVTLLSVSSDKDAAQMIDLLAPISHPLILTEYAGGRCMPLEQLQQCAKDHPHLALADLPEALATGMRLATPDRPLLITGSIYAAGETRRLLIKEYGAAPLLF